MDDMLFSVPTNNAHVLCMCVYVWFSMFNIFIDYEKKVVTFIFDSPFMCLYWCVYIYKYTNIHVLNGM